MRLAIFGATGGTGRALVEQALAAGHSVRALVRDPDGAGLPGAVTVVRGDVRDPAPVAETVAGTEAVISTLGAALSKSHGALGKVTADGMPHIVAAMKQHGVTRLVVVSAFGAGESHAQIGFAFRMVMKTALRGIYADKNAMEPIVRASGLDWTLVRPTNLGSGAASGKLTVDPPGTLGLGDKIARADVAAFVLQAVADPALIGKAPIITGG